MCPTQKGGEELLACGLEAWPSLEKILADQAYEGPLVTWVLEEYDTVLEIVRKEEGQKGFVVQPGRWVVERSIACLNRYRRLSKDYERLVESSEARIYIASIQQLLRRLRPNPSLRKPYSSKSKSASSRERVPDT